MYQSHGCNGCGNGRNGRGELGWMQYIPLAIDYGTQIFGGDGGGDGGGGGGWLEYYQRHWDKRGSLCPGAPDPEQAAGAVGVNPRAFSRIREQLAASNNGLAPSLLEMSDPTLAHLWVQAVMGGADCENKSARWMIEELHGLVSQYAPAFPTPPTTYPPAPTSPTYPTAPTAPTAPTNGGGGAWYGGILEWGRDRLDDFLEQGVDQATGWAFDNLPEEQKRQIELEYMRRRGSQVGQSAAIPVLIGLGLIGAVVAARKRN